MTTCLQCKHFALRDSPLRAHGFGLCKHVPQPGRTFSLSNVCRLGKWSAAPADVVAARQRAVEIVEKAHTK